MNLNEVVVSNLITKYQENKRRMIAAVEQLSDEQLNWRPNESSNSIANLIIHIEGNIKQRIASGILGASDNRKRDMEFATNIFFSRDELIKKIEDTFQLLMDVSSKQTSLDLLKPQKIRDQQVTVFDVLNHCGNHSSEHLGQIIYIAKMLLNERFLKITI